jgi:hypothetical protein
LRLLPTLRPPAAQFLRQVVLLRSKLLGLRFHPLPLRLQAANLIYLRLTERGHLLPALRSQLLWFRGLILIIRIQQCVQQIVATAHDDLRERVLRHATGDDDEPEYCLGLV